jgi:hypothetical protein
MLLLHAVHESKSQSKAGRPDKLSYQARVKLCTLPVPVYIIAGGVVFGLLKKLTSCVSCQQKLPVVAVVAGGVTSEEDRSIGPARRLLLVLDTNWALLS